MPVVRQVSELFSPSHTIVLDVSLYAYFLVRWSRSGPPTDLGGRARRELSVRCVPAVELVVTVLDVKISYATISFLGYCALPFAQLCGRRGSSSCIGTLPFAFFTWGTPLSTAHHPILAMPWHRYRWRMPKRLWRGIGALLSIL